MSKDAKKKWYAENKEYVKSKALQKKEELRSIIIAIKNNPCMDCGVSYPHYVMDFDHRDPSLKLSNVSSLINMGNKQKLLEEIAKCDLVCANCHRIRTYKSLRNGPVF
jgi:hypothetical protein